MTRILITGLLLPMGIALSGCGDSNPSEKPQETATTAALLPILTAPQAWPEIAAIEAKTGGRIGVALINSATGQVLHHRGEERFAMCSTFKMPLAGAVLSLVDAGKMKLEDQISFTKTDMLNNSPVVEDALKAAGGAKSSLTIADLAKGTVQRSDNASANLLLVPVGGPDALTKVFRSWGDSITRVDRNEPSMNENVPGDPRDTSTPVAMAGLTRTMLEGDVLKPESRKILSEWMIGTQTGVKRIRAGLPADMLVGNKTGTCGTAWNDVAFFRPQSATGAAQASYYLAIFIDRPTAKDDAVEAAMADIARMAAAKVQAK